MKQLNWFQKWVLRSIGINPEAIVQKEFNVEQALRDTWTRAKQRYLAEGRKEKADCRMCPLWKQDQIRLHGRSEPIGAYEPPSPTTDGKIAAQGARQKHITRNLQEHPGTLMQHDRLMREQKKRATDGPYTDILPRYHKMTWNHIPPNWIN